MKNKLVDHVVDNCLDRQGNPVNNDARGVLLVALCSVEKDHVSRGYKANHGRGRCIRKDGSFDYLKMSQLVHAGEW